MEFISRGSQYKAISTANSLSELIDRFNGNFVPCGPYSLAIFRMPHFSPDTKALTFSSYVMAFIATESSGIVCLDPVLVTDTSSGYSFARQALAYAPSDMFFGDCHNRKELYELADGYLKTTHFLPLDILEPFMSDVRELILAKEFPCAVESSYYDVIDLEGSKKVVLFSRDDLNEYTSSNCSIDWYKDPTLPLSDVTFLSFNYSSGFSVLNGPLVGKSVRFEDKVLPKSYMQIRGTSLYGKTFEGASTKNVFCTRSSDLSLSSNSENIVNCTFFPICIDTLFPLKMIIS